jgi:hypothetical protein
MRSGILTSLIVVALCAGAATAGQPGPSKDGAIQAPAVADPNDPNEPNNTWDAVKHFTQRWDAVTLAFRTDGESTVPDRTVSVACVVTVTDPTGIIGFSPVPTGVLALDRDANVICDLPPDSPRSYEPLRYVTTLQDDEWVSEIQPYAFSVEVPLGEPNSPGSFFMLSRVQWSMYALVTTRFEAVDLPFAPSAEWVEVTPGLQVLVEQATVDEGRYQYRLKVKYDPRQVLCRMGSAIETSLSGPIPATAVVKMEILNALSWPTQDEATGGSFSGSSKEMTGTMSGMGACDKWGPATTIRFTLGLDVCEKEIRFLLENVPVPIPVL